MILATSTLPSLTFYRKMVNPDEDTEFNDALRRHGILPPKPPSRSPSPDIPHITHTDAVRAVAATADADQLVTLIEGDNLDSDDERMFEEYKRKRLHEMKKEEKKGRFGSMEPLAREDFVREVTEGSKGTGVVVFLFKDSVPLSQHLQPLLNQAAAAHPSTKFLSIPAGLCIPNYPDKNVPTLLIYRNGEMVGNVVAGMGLKGMKTTVRDLEGLLLYFKAVEKPSAALLRSNGANEHSDSDDDFNDDIGTVNTRGGGLRTGGVGIGAGRGKEDSDDSDFDM
ncbi:hypothetical protein CNBF2160 [Cryptococcus deneoformans B-3501A]|uniref:hypothetical protein n=1 Tax=Cryptococcus deneoformans (strain B-3501A) TaxID=283643 RepID=UPI000042EB59|nr:hypothetical protein CNBF2160 [Cryptococcus neoformans var. neoformans B-3501A]EAL20139.1 hypothetical protein CNBF2160 [Cryptococcus neoformans var. neoformans B-3501A]